MLNKKKLLYFVVENRILAISFSLLLKSLAIYFLLYTLVTLLAWLFSKESHVLFYFGAFIYDVICFSNHFDPPFHVTSCSSVIKCLLSNFWDLSMAYSVNKQSLSLAKGQLKSEWINEVLIFQNSNKDIVRISGLKFFTDHILMFAISYIY